jgi:hypothetical protein
MNSYFLPEKDYALIEFTTKETEIIKRVKEYSKRNCRNEIQSSYITKALDVFDYGLAYFKTEILIANKIKKIAHVLLLVLRKKINIYYIYC